MLPYCIVRLCKWQQTVALLAAQYSACARVHASQELVSKFAANLTANRSGFVNNDLLCCSPVRRSLKQLQALALAGAEAGGEALQASPAGKGPAAANKAVAANKAAVKVSCSELQQCSLHAAYSCRDLH